MTLRTTAAAGASLLALSLTLTACGGSDSGSSTGKGSGSATPSTSFDVAPATGAQVDGDGYSVKVPQGWTDVTAQVKKQQSRVDSAYTSRTAVSGFRPNVNVIVIENAYSGRLSDSVLDANAKQVVDQLSSGGAKDVTAEKPVRVAGDPALHVTADLGSGSATYHTDQYFIFHDGDGYAVTFSTPTTFTEKQRDAVSDPSLASWAWS